MATAMKAAPAPAGYEMPRPGIGEIVIYFRDASGDPKSAAPAMVVRVSGRSLELRVESGEGRQIRVYDVLHMTDPLLESDSRRQAGAWDFTEQHKLIVDLANRVETLEYTASKK